MLKLSKDLQNLIISYLDPTTYSRLNILDGKFSITRYEELYIRDLVKNIKVSDLENGIIKDYTLDILNLARGLFNSM